MTVLSTPKVRHAARFAALAVALLPLLAPARPARAAQDDDLPTRFTLEDLGAVSGASGYSVEAMNVHGEVVGWSVNVATGNASGFRSTPSGEALSLFDIGSRGGPNTYAYDINDAGQVVGHSQMSVTDMGQTGIVHRAFRLAPGETLTRDTPTFGGFRFPTRDFSYAFGINNAGYVAGANSYNGRDHSATLWGPSGEDINIDHSVIGHRYRALDINDNQMVVGDAYDNVPPLGGGGSFWAWRVQLPGTLLGPGTNSIGASEGTTIGGMNNGGIIVGSTVRMGTRQAFRNGPTEMVWSSPLLGTLGGDYSHAADINDFGQIVGEARTASGANRAFLYTLAGVSEQLFNLNDLLDNPTPGLLLRSATGINERGQIVGSGTVDGRSFSYRLTPVNVSSAVPEPSTLALVLAGAGLMLLSPRRRP